MGDKVLDAGCCGVCCNDCVDDFYDLTDLLMASIRHLEAKAVFLRYSLSLLLPEHDGEMLRSDIFSDLSGGFQDHPAYRQYVAEYHDGHDQLNEIGVNEFMRKLACGTATVNL